MRFFRFLMPGVASLALMTIIGCNGEEPSPPPPPPDPDAAAAAAAGTEAAKAKPTRGSSTVNEKQGSGSARDPAMGPAG